MFADVVHKVNLHTVTSVLLQVQTLNCVCVLPPTKRRSKLVFINLSMTEVKRDKGGTQSSSLLSKEDGNRNKAQPPHQKYFIVLVTVSCGVLSLMCDRCERLYDDQVAFSGWCTKNKHPICILQIEKTKREMIQTGRRFSFCEFLVFAKLTNRTEPLNYLYVQIKFGPDPSLRRLIKCAPPTPLQKNCRSAQQDAF